MNFDQQIDDRHSGFVSWNGALQILDDMCRRVMRKQSLKSLCQIHQFAMQGSLLLLECPRLMLALDQTTWFEGLIRDSVAEHAQKLSGVPRCVDQHHAQILVGWFDGDGRVSHELGKESLV